MSVLKYKRVLVVYKKTALQMAKGTSREQDLQRLMDREDPLAHRVLSAHEEHLDSLARAEKALAALGVKALFRHRCTAKIMSRHDLVITLGGDGTLLWTSHFIGADRPVVAINSAPASSVGYFSAGDRHSLEETLARAVQGEMKPTRLSRMRVSIDDKAISSRVLNDILFCHECPAATSRYALVAGGKEEAQRSSGVWAGPSAGSTAALKSAGGKELPIGSKKIQWVVREPYARPGGVVRLRRGIVRDGESLVLRSQMHRGRIFVDGAHRVRRVPFGSRVEIGRSDEGLVVLGLRNHGA
jgi:NAD+ kinase